MESRYLTVAQRKRLEAEVRRTDDAALFRRLLALLEVDYGRPVPEVARELRVGRSSVYRWIERYLAEGRPEALEHRPGQGRPPQRSQELEEWLVLALAQPPLEMDYPANGWTLPLLQAFLSVYLPEQKVSISTLRRRLKEMGYVWKRFRYCLLPDPEEEKKTASSGQNPSFACSYRSSGSG